MGLHGYNEHFPTFSGQTMQKHFWREKSKL